MPSLSKAAIKKLVMSAVGREERDLPRAVARTMRGGAALGGGALGGGRARKHGGAYLGGGAVEDLLGSARSAIGTARGLSKRYARPALDIVDEFVPEARGHTRRARAVLDAVGGAYLGGGRPRASAAHKAALAERRRRVMREAQRLIQSGYPKGQALREAWASY
jgi:hypothetical protein